MSSCPHYACGWPQADLNQRSYVSYSSPRLTGYIGWQPSGGFGIKLNFSNGDYAAFG